MRGIILAGGKATRLGPLAAQLNKSLVSIGQQPMLVRQVQQLQRAGCDTIDVVTSPGSDDQVRNVIDCAGLPNVYTSVQPEPLGPGDALGWGLQLIRREDVLVLMADTLLADEDVINLTTSSAVAVAAAPATRPFCVKSPLSDRWLDAEVAAGTANVAVGAFFFQSAAALERIIKKLRRKNSGDEIGMADVLNDYGVEKLQLVPVTSWQDVGDVPALARATRSRFISRAFHDLEIETPGTVTKHGDVAAQAQAIKGAPISATHLYPRVLSETDRSYTMEHIDMPSLAELWLYWPSRPEMWRHVGAELVSQLRSALWQDPSISPYTRDEMRARAHEMYVTKLTDRYLGPDAPARAFGAWDYVDTLHVNGHTVVAGERLIELVTQQAARRFAVSAPRWAGWLHGDPNFTNVLWSLRTGSFKLLDPRPEWGGKSSWGDTRYDLGKIAYSPEFSAITHRLFTLRSAPGGVWRIELWPERSVSAAELRSELILPPAEMLLLRAHMMLSSAPLHPEPEASALYLMGALAAQRYIDTGGVL